MGEDARSESLRRRLAADPESSEALAALDRLERRRGRLGLRLIPRGLELPELPGWVCTVNRAGRTKRLVYWRWFEGAEGLLDWARGDRRFVLGEGSPWPARVELRIRLGDALALTPDEARLAESSVFDLGAGLAFAGGPGLQLSLHPPAGSEVPQGAGLALPLRPPRLPLTLRRGALGELAVRWLGAGSAVDEGQAISLRAFDRLGLLALWASLTGRWREAWLFRPEHAPLTPAARGRELVRALAGPPRWALLQRCDGGFRLHAIEAAAAGPPRVSTFQSDDFAEVVAAARALFFGAGAQEAGFSGPSLPGAALALPLFSEARP